MSGEQLPSNLIDIRGIRLLGKWDNSQGVLYYCYDLRPGFPAPFAAMMEENSGKSLNDPSLLWAVITFDDDEPVYISPAGYIWTNSGTQDVHTIPVGILDASIDRQPKIRDRLPGEPFIGPNEKPYTLPTSPINGVTFYTHRQFAETIGDLAA